MYNVELHSTALMLFDGRFGGELNRNRPGHNNVTKGQKRARRYSPKISAVVRMDHSNKQ